MEGIIGNKLMIHDDLKVIIDYYNGIRNIL
jgi:hypothetical protein